MESSPADIQALANLLKAPKPRGYAEGSDSESEEEKTTNTYKPITPASIGTEKATPNAEDKANAYVKTEQEKKLHEGIYDPETDEFFPETDETVPDWKKSPEWNICYKQNVTPSDVFLNMSGRSNATFSCEDMIVTVKLPGESRQNMDLKVRKETLQLTSPQYFLRIPLPHPVDPQRGNSKWDADKEELVCSLRMEREFDFVNF